MRPRLIDRGVFCIDKAFDEINTDDVSMLVLKYIIAIWQKALTEISA